MLEEKNIFVDSHLHFIALENFIICAEYGLSGLLLRAVIDERYLSLIKCKCKLKFKKIKLRKFRRIHAKNGLFSFLSRGKFINLPIPARENLYVA